MATKANATTEEETPSEQVMDNMVRFAAGELRGIESFDDALALIEREYGNILYAEDEIGSGFVQMAKHTLLEVPFAILTINFPKSDKFTGPDGAPVHFAAINLVTQDGRKGWLVDGGTGIYAQLDEWCMRTNRHGGLMVRRGLRESRYDYTDADGKTSEAVTYYLNV